MSISSQFILFFSTLLDNEALKYFFGVHFKMVETNLIYLIFNFTEPESLEIFGMI